jgi:uncharacterized membrane protein
MTTVVLVLALLTLPALVGALIERFSSRAGALRLGGVIGLSLAFGLFAFGHFVMTDALVEMLPPWVPWREPLVLATGALELAIAAGLLGRKSRRLAGLMAAAVLVLFFPANIYAALHSVGPAGHQLGPAYLLLRAPLQLFLLFWVYWFALRSTRLAADPVMPMPAAGADASES